MRAALVLSAALAACTPGASSPSAADGAAIGGSGQIGSLDSGPPDDGGAADRTGVADGPPSAPDGDTDQSGGDTTVGRDPNEAGGSTNADATAGDVGQDAPAGDLAAERAVQDSSPDGGGTAAVDATGDAHPADDAGAPGAITSAVDIADVFSGDPVAFALVTRGNQQFVAYYDANRQMTVAQRTLDSPTWTFAKLPSVVGWDSHNDIALGIDDGGFVHVSGNMHAAPLVYFRTTQPLDVGTFQRVSAMVGANEQSCTYPQFLRGPGGAFIYAYRDGASGDGNYVFNVYDSGTGKWRRFLNTPLLDGQGQRNAYPVGPLLGPDGWWHLVYVWRETADASSNHDLCYARSKDLLSWQTGAGKPLTLPITLATSDVVDPVLQNGGIINNNTVVGFDAQNRPIVGYHKFDAAGNTQLYNARVENGRWASHQASSWNYRWAIGGTGTLIFQIRLEGVRPDVTPGALIQPWYHMQLGGWNAFRLDEATLTATATIGRTLPYPVSLERVESATPGMGVRWAADAGASPDATVRYMLRWETLPENQDQPRATIPPPTRLRVYGLRR